jgi:hypothetical protein
MSEPSSRELNEKIADIREWLVRIDTKVDFFHEVKRIAEDADEKAGKALTASEENAKDIDGLKKFLMWATGLLTTGMVTLAAAVITVLF